RPASANPGAPADSDTAAPAQAKVLNTAHGVWHPQLATVSEQPLRRVGRPGQAKIRFLSMAVTKPLKRDTASLPRVRKPWVIRGRQPLVSSAAPETPALLLRGLRRQERELGAHSSTSITGIPALEASFSVSTWPPPAWSVTTSICGIGNEANSASRCWAPWRGSRHH